jgi:hypothetical protein
MRRTSPTDLVITLIVIGLAVYIVLRASYASLPPLQYLVPVPIAALGIAELVAAHRVRAAVRHDPRARPMPAIVIARCVALGKASSLVGAGVVGAAVALLVRVAPDAGTVSAATNDVKVGAFLLAAALLLVAAGLLLERAGVDPNNKDEHDDRGKSSR